MKRQQFLKRVLNMASASLICAAVFSGSPDTLSPKTPSAGGAESMQETQSPNTDDKNVDRPESETINKGDRGNGNNEISPHNDNTDKHIRPKH